MPAELTFSAGALYGFLLVLARVGGALSFVPLPGIKGAPESARAALAAGLALALFPRWPAVEESGVTPARLAGWALSEAAVGLAIGVAMAVVLECFSLAAQILGLQAGYAYASTIDPSTEADSGVLLVVAQLAAGLMFFTLGLDREVVRVLARSLETIPAGAGAFGREAGDAMIALYGSLFSAGMRLAFPVVALLVMVDVALALLGRLNQQLQLLALAFPVKMLTALLTLSWIAALYPRLMGEVAGSALAAARRLMGL